MAKTKQQTPSKKNDIANKQNRLSGKQIQSQSQKPSITKPSNVNLMFRKRQWSEREDRMLRKAIEQHGASKWAFIATFVPNRVGKQCRERWHNHLNPNIKKQEWSEQEEWLLYLMQFLQRGKWSKMTKLLSDRTDNSIKNHWNSIMQKKLHKYETKLSLILEKLQNQSDRVQSQQYLKTFSEKEQYLISKIIEKRNDNSKRALSLLNNSQEENHSFGFEESEFPDLESLENNGKSQLKEQQPKRDDLLSQELPGTSQELALREKNISLMSNGVQGEECMDSDFSFNNVLKKLQDETPSLNRQSSYKYSSFNPTSLNSKQECVLPSVEPRLRKKQSSSYNGDIFGTNKKRKSNESFMDKEELVNSPKDNAVYEELYNSEEEQNSNEMIEGLQCLNRSQLRKRRSSCGKAIVSPEKFMAERPLFGKDCKSFEV